jgi:4-diphosphocytidyl-2C-methyl-D-erythritol kinase
VTIDDFSLGLFKYNTATAAIEKMQKKYKFDNKFRITIHKVIPMQSGLGGGSSNAGAVINAVNDYCKLNLPYEELVDIATGLGADIPFFISNKPARCRGIGEKLDFINVKNDYYALIVKPAQGCSTQQIYEVSDTMDLPIGDVEKVQRALETGDDDLLADSIFNALEGPAISVVPEIPTKSILSKIEYPKMAMKQGIEGVVYLELFIDENGNIRQVNVLKDPGYGFAEAAIAALDGIICKPALMNDKPVAVRFRYPVRFVLS